MLNPGKSRTNPMMDPSMAYLFSRMAGLQGSPEMSEA